MADSASWRASLGGAIGLLLLLTACGRSDEGQAPVAVNASAAATASPLPNHRTTAERKALEAYVGMIQAWVAAAEIPDPDAPMLREFASGEALKRLVTDLYLAREEGTIGRGQPVSRPSVVDAIPSDIPTEVRLSDCLDDSTWLEYKTSGELRDDIPGGRHQVMVMVKDSDTGWKVDSFALQKVGTC